MKEAFVAPEVEVINFPEMDIVTTSGTGNLPGGGNGGGGGIVLPDDEW